MKKFNPPPFPEPRTPLYEMVIGKSGVAWFYPANWDNPADQILCTNSENWDEPGEGFGGSTLNLQLVNGETFELKGGWHSNGDSLLADTGISLKSQYYTYCVIAEEVMSHNPLTLDKVLYEDLGWSLGEFERPEKLAQKFANELGKEVYLAKRSSGGGMYGYIQPNTVSTRQKV